MFDRFHTNGSTYEQRERAEARKRAEENKDAWEGEAGFVAKRAGITSVNQLLVLQDFAKHDAAKLGPFAVTAPDAVRIAQRTAMPLDTVRACLGSLEMAGLLKREAVPSGVRLTAKADEVLRAAPPKARPAQKAAVQRQKGEVALVALPDPGYELAPGMIPTGKTGTGRITAIKCPSGHDAVFRGDKLMGFVPRTKADSALPHGYSRRRAVEA